MAAQVQEEAAGPLPDETLAVVHVGQRWLVLAQRWLRRGSRGWWWRPGECCHPGWGETMCCQRSGYAAIYRGQTQAGLAPFS